jgi:hypothetical protein
MEHEMMTGPWLGNLIIVILAGGITLGCFVTMFWMLLRPGETDPRHPKYSILSDDR